MRNFRRQFPIKLLTQSHVQLTLSLYIYSASNQFMRKEAVVPFAYVNNKGTRQSAYLCTEKHHEKFYFLNLNQQRRRSADHNIINQMPCLSLALMLECRGQFFKAS